MGEHHMKTQSKDSHLHVKDSLILDLRTVTNFLSFKLPCGTCYSSLN